MHMHREQVGDRWGCVRVSPSSALAGVTSELPAPADTYLHINPKEFYVLSTLNISMARHMASTMDNVNAAQRTIYAITTPPAKL